MTVYSLSVIENYNTPIQFAEYQGEKYAEQYTLKYRKNRSQIFTSSTIATFMAGLVETNKSVVHVLDPGAGTGILSCAVLEQLYKCGGVEEIILHGYENDEVLAGILHLCYENAFNWLAKRNIKLTYEIFTEDFILANANSKGLFAEKPIYDIVIGNPPYKKINKADPRSIAAKDFVFGQPNLYSLFMGVAARMLVNSGELIFITPRSYINGSYFKAFRREFFAIMKPELIHVFDSRKDTFKRDDVLQETIITKARKESSSNEPIIISSSIGALDLQNSYKYILSLDSIFVRGCDGIPSLRLPLNENDMNSIRQIEKWDQNLQTLGLQISTGPVVPFRTEKHIVDFVCDEHETCPLLWMRHVNHMKIDWTGKTASDFILVDDITLERKLVLQNSNFVLLRRFSSKEQNRRLISAPLLKKQIDFRFIGIENHLNYIYKTAGELKDIEAIGISAILNSSVVDNYFRIINGNTQVNATEIRNLPLPSAGIIREIGIMVKQLPKLAELDEIDFIIDTINKRYYNLSLEYEPEVI